MAREYPRKKTPISLPEMGRAIIEAHRSYFGTDPTQERAELLMALMMHETANGASVYNHNWGNMTPMPAEDYYKPAWHQPWVDDMPEDTEEQRKRKSLYQWMRTQSDKPSKFRHSPSHEAGVRAYLARMATSPTHARMLTAADTGDLYEFHQATTTAHPETKMAWVLPAEGNKPEVRAEYGRRRDMVRQGGFFARLPSKKKDQEEESPPTQREGEAAGSSSSTPSAPASFFSPELDADPPDLEVGNNGLAVVLLQGCLKRKSAIGLVVDGLFGGATRHAVQRFQDDHELQVDGVVGPFTWATIAEHVQT